MIRRKKSLGGSVMIMDSQKTKEGRGQYRSRGEGLVRDALAAHSGHHVSAEQLRSYLLGQGESIGLSTVYRHLDRMEERGEAMRISGGGSMACYRYVSETCGEHYHLYCTECGRTEHISCPEIEELIRHISNEHSFSVDGARTLLYGRCAACRGISEKEEAARGCGHEGHEHEEKK